MHGLSEELHLSFNLTWRQFGREIVRRHRHISSGTHLMGIILSSVSQKNGLETEASL
jgi:hypothetical protein